MPGHAPGGRTCHARARSAGRVVAMRSRRHPRPAVMVAVVAIAAGLLAVGGSGAASGAVAAPAPPPDAHGTWSWPIAPPHPVARAYLAPPTPYGAGHRGIDIGAAEGSPVLAPDDGVVHFAGVVVDRPVL